MEAYFLFLLKLKLSNSSLKIVKQKEKKKEMKRGSDGFAQCSTELVKCHYNVACSIKLIIVALYVSLTRQQR